jgi:hypothetical protein
MAIVCPVVIVTNFNFVGIVTANSTVFIGCYRFIGNRLFGWNNRYRFYGAQKIEIWKNVKKTRPTSYNCMKQTGLNLL